MPRPRARPLFELGDQWIAKDPGSPFLHRFWTEPGSGRTRRASLGTADLGQAKLKLAEIILTEAPKTNNSPLAIVLERYFDGHADALPSGKVARGHGRRLLLFFGATARIIHLTDAKQQEFVKACLEEGLKLAYAARIMTTLSAALTYSEIREPKIAYTESAMKKLWKLSSSPVKQAYIPTDAECARLIVSDMPEMLRRWLIIQAMTAGRPQTGIDLSPNQVNRESGIIDLNPPNRPQNKKYRAKIRAGRALLKMLKLWKAKGLDPFAGRYCGYTSLEGVKTALQKLAAATGVRVSTYSFRQKATTVMRKARVPEDQVAMMLGHRRSNLRTTAGYGDWDPDYQLDAAKALDSWFWKVRRMSKGFVTNTRPTPDLEVVGNTQINK